MAPRTTYSAAIHAALVDAIRKVGFIETACDLIQVPRSSVYYWMRRGRAGVAPFDQFLADVLSARAQKQIDLEGVARFDKGGAQWLLSKMFQAQYGERAKDTREVAQTLIEAVLHRMSPSAQIEFLDAIEAFERERVSGEPGVSGGEEAGDREAEAIDVDGESVEPRRLESGTR
jgi:hypothetical protein